MYHASIYLSHAIVSHIALWYAGNVATVSASTGSADLGLGVTTKQHALFNQLQRVDCVAHNEGRAKRCRH